MKKKKDLISAIGTIGEMKEGYNDTKAFLDSKKWDRSRKGVAASHGVLLAAFELVHSCFLKKESTKGFVLLSLEMYWEFVKSKKEKKEIKRKETNV